MSMNSGTEKDILDSLDYQGGSRKSRQPDPAVAPGSFEIFDWFPAHQSCQAFFLDHAQYDYSVQAVAALVNIGLPFQWRPNPVLSSHGSARHPPTSSSAATSAGEEPAGPPSSSPPQPPLEGMSPGGFPPREQENMVARPWVSLVPYVRRLVVTGFDKDAVMHGFFGNDWKAGVGPTQECERRNYLFAVRASKGNWNDVKRAYDADSNETVPFLQQLQGISAAEVDSAARLWDQWLSLSKWTFEPGSMQDSKVHQDSVDRDM